MRMMAIAGSALMLVCGSPVWADEDYDKCLSAASAEPAQAECGRAYVARAEAAMNSVWERTLLVSEPETRVALDKEQNAWRQFQEAVCQLYFSTTDFGPEIQATKAYQCQAQNIEARTLQLRDYIRNIDP